VVTAAKVGDQWSLSVADGPRRRIYTQAQLLEMILCLAKCCGGDHQDQPPSDTLQITGIQFLRVTGTGAPEANLPTRLVGISPRQPDAYPPVFDAIPPPAGGIGGGGDWDPIVLRISFNQAIEGSTVTLLPPLPHDPLGYTLTVAPLDTPGGTENETQPFQSLLEDANSVLMICPGAPGAYRLIMRGDPVPASPPGSGPGLPAVTTWDPDPAKRRNLDGEVGRPPHFPSGDNADGGNFEYSYELRPKDAADPFRIERIVFQHDDAATPIPIDLTRTGSAPPPWTPGTTFSFQKEFDTIRIVFNAPVDVDSVRAGLAITSDVGGGGPVPGDITADPHDKNTIVRAHLVPESVNPKPYPEGNYTVELSSGVIKDVPVPGTTARSLSGKAHSPDPPLPTEGVPGADKFTFYFTVTA
jgi:hypothetical protein